MKLYTCRRCNKKVDLTHTCDKKEDKPNLWKSPQSQRSKTLQLLIKQNKIKE